MNDAVLGFLNRVTPLASCSKDLALGTLVALSAPRFGAALAFTGAGACPGPGPPELCAGGVMRVGVVKVPGISSNGFDLGHRSRCSAPTNPKKDTTEQQMVVWCHIKIHLYLNILYYIYGFICIFVYIYMFLYKKRMLTWIITYLSSAQQILSGLMVQQPILGHFNRLLHSRWGAFLGAVPAPVHLQILSQASLQGGAMVMEWTYISIYIR